MNKKQVCPKRGPNAINYDIYRTLKNAHRLNVLSQPNKHLYCYTAE